MSAFNVTSIIDGDTFEVSPQWQWNGQTGTRVRPAGYDAPELHAYGGQVAKDKLSKLILGEQVDPAQCAGREWRGARSGADHRAHLCRLDQIRPHRALEGGVQDT